MMGGTVNPNPIEQRVVALLMFLSQVLDALKPHRAEALQRVRTNAFCLLILVLLSYLLPLPSIPTALKHVLIQNSAKRVGAMGSRVFSTAVPIKRWSGEWVYSWMCTI